MQGALLRIARDDAYTVHEMQSSSGTAVREYVSSTGTVFAVAWQGPWLPDLRQLLGPLSTTISGPSRRRPAKRRARGPLTISLPDLTVQITGHPRAFSAGPSCRASCRSACRQRRFDSSARAAAGEMVHRTLLLSALLVAQELTPQCGGTPSSSVPAAPADNVQSILVNAGPTGDYFNGAFTSVTICAPGRSTGCQTIDGVLVDTGSTGLRVLSSALTLSLPQQVGASGAPIVECAQFLDGFTWGPVQTADVKLAGEQASAVPIQVIDERAFPNIPTACSRPGSRKTHSTSSAPTRFSGLACSEQDCGRLRVRGRRTRACTTCPATGAARRVARQPAAESRGVVLQGQQRRGRSASSRGGRWNVLGDGLARLRHRHTVQ